MREQVGLHKARLDREHMDAAARQSVTQGFQVRGQPSLGGIVSWVAHPPPVSGDGGYPN